MDHISYKVGQTAKNKGFGSLEVYQDSKYSTQEKSY